MSKQPERRFAATLTDQQSWQSIPLLTRIAGYSVASSLLLGTATLAQVSPADPPVYSQAGDHTPDIIDVGGPLIPGHGRPPLRLNANPAAGVYYSPTQIRHAYGFDQIAADGTGQKIAIVDAYGNGSIQSDLDAFCNQFGLPQTSVLIYGPNGNLDRGWALETALDVEWAHAIAPRATIILCVAASNSDSDLLAAVDKAVSLGANVVSMSWGGSEWGGATSYDSHFSNPNVTFVASSGDSGESTAVEWPAVSPYVVGVGGTTLYLDSSNNRTSEVGWNGSGGGLSTVYSTPTWQVGWSSYLTRRGVPDVSYNADPSTGFLVCDSVYGGGSLAWYAVGGTSAGAPQWAALIALANQSGAASGANNPDIYAAAGTAPSINSADFYDITSGSNGTHADDYAVKGYDLVTGLGSPAVKGFVASLVGGGTTTPDFSLSVSPTSQSVSPGATATYKVTVTALGGFGGTVNLTMGSTPSGLSGSFSPASIVGAGSSTLTVIAPSSGTYTITITGSSGALTHSVTANLAVNSTSSTGDFSISATPSAVTVNHGSPATYNVTITPSAGFSGSVSLSVTGLPKASNGSFTPASVSSGNSTLTIKTTNGTGRGTFKLTITGTSGSLTRSTSVTLTVK